MQINIKELSDRQLMILISKIQSQLIDLEMQHKILKEEFDRRVLEGDNSIPND